MGSKTIISSAIILPIIAIIGIIGVSNITPSADADKAAALYFAMAFIGVALTIVSWIAAVFCVKYWLFGEVNGYGTRVSKGVFPYYNKLLEADEVRTLNT